MATGRERIARQPQWVVRFVEGLEKEVEYWQRRALAYEGKERSEVTIQEFERGASRGRDVPLPRGSRVRFWPGKSPIECYVSEGALVVRGDDVLDIAPSSSNSFEVRVVNPSRKDSL